MAHADSCPYLFMLEDASHDLSDLAWRIRAGAMTDLALVAATLERLAISEPMGSCDWELPDETLLLVEIEAAVSAALDHRIGNEFAPESIASLLQLRDKYEKRIREQIGF